jgi:PmbA protein
LDFDPRISNSEGGSFDSHTGLQVFANSRGFLSSYRYSSVSASAVPVAKEGDEMERDYWVSSARDTAGLEKPEDIGRRAAERTIRRLGAKKVATQKVPIVFEPRVARSLLGDIFDAINGDAIYRHQSFLTGKLGEKIASDKVTVIDDGTIPGLFGTSPFDDEGVPSRRTVVIEHGVLKNYLLNTYTARKLGMKTTGNAARGITGNPGISHGNFYLEAGEKTQDEIIASILQGFYVTELIGSGVNVVTGDYSRGAVGVWIENGALTYPVAEVTIAGTLQEMLMGIVAIGSDLEFRGSTASPTIMVGEMTVSGQ